MNSNSSQFRVIVIHNLEQELLDESTGGAKVDGTRVLSPSGQQRRGKYFGRRSSIPSLNRGQSEAIGCESGRIFLGLAQMLYSAGLLDGKVTEGLLGDYFCSIKGMAVI